MELSGPHNGAGLSLRELRERASSLLHRQSPGPGSGGPSDYDLDRQLGVPPAGDHGGGGLRQAAVLIPIVEAERLSVILTVRTAHLNSHAGQIAFPGGKLDPGESALASALREADEEIGLAQSFVEPLGFLDSYTTRTGFAVAPLVGLVKPGFSLKANPEEVEDVFEVPLDFLLDEQNHQKHSRDWQGHKRHYYAMPYGDRYIWGATAGMIRNLQQRLALA